MLFFLEEQSHKWYHPSNKTVGYLLSHKMSQNENVCRKDKHKVVFENGHGICEKHRQGCIISVMVFFRRRTGEKEVTERRGGGGQEGKKRKEQEREKRCVKGGEKWRLGGGTGEEGVGRGWGERMGGR